ncbi:hypothetical protein [Aeromonas sp. QDB03]|uniref:hypothetical protein n=1 Tax=Aeromonas sp. QDB03 TaxID=2989839 RepID=UPI0022E43742|nr:hypothetical protein [Aeromonas sp. QDB03]
MEKEYPEWVHHVGMGYQDGRRNKAWCGSNDRPFFIDPGHAALNGLHQGRLVACPECVNAIWEALKNGHDDISHESDAGIENEDGN